MSKLLLLNRADLPIDDQGYVNDRVLQPMADLTSQGFRLILMTPQPDRWQPTRGSLDRDLHIQQTLHKQFKAAGVSLDGIYYLKKGSFSKKHLRIQSVEDLLDRCSSTDKTVWLSSSKPDWELAEKLGIVAIRIQSEQQGKGTGKSLLTALKQVDRQLK